MMLIVICYKRKPVQKITEQKDNKCTLEYFPKHQACVHFAPAAHNKAHGITHCKHKRREYKIGWRKAIPVCMLKRGKRSVSVARCIYNDHQADRHSAKYIECKETLRSGRLHSSRLIFKVRSLM